MTGLFASDLDGTLLNERHEVDRTIRRALAAVCGSGRHFAVATGRTMRSNHDFGFGGLPIEAICSNGGMIIDAEGELARFRALPKAFLEELLRAFPDVPFDCVGRDHTYTRGSREAWLACVPASRALKAGMSASARGMRPGERVFDVDDAGVLAHDICKVNCRVSGADAALSVELGAFMADHAGEAVNAPFDPVLFEITAAGVNKGEAVAWLAARLGIGEDEVAVYGDGGNDVAMLSRFARSYATRGACADARAVAAETIGSNRWHAVPRHIMRTIRREGRSGRPRGCGGREGARPGMGEVRR